MTNHHPFYPVLDQDVWTWLDGFKGEMEELANQYDIGFILVDDNSYFDAFVKNASSRPWDEEDNFPRQFYLLWRSSPVDPDALLSWRNGLIEGAKSGEKFYRYRFVSIDSDVRAFISKIRSRTKEWPGERPVREEENGLSLKTYVRFHDQKKHRHYDPGFLTICPDSKLDSVFEQLDEVRRAFANIIGPNVDKRRAEIHKPLAFLLASDKVIDTKLEELTVSVSKHFDLVEKRHILPRVLLLGESGTGKTLVAHYLAWRLSLPVDEKQPHSRPFRRVPLPEYGQDTDRFEHDLYGYQAGAFTGARESGSLGYLLHDMGGVIFFDEIGEANPVLQTKLLAFLDDYQVRPRGWDGDSIFCPMLIIAATNRPLAAWSSEDSTLEIDTKFRNDLFQRFNVIIEIPGLNDRRDELPYILDAMLQTDAFNPGGKIEHVGKQAIETLMSMDFKNKNFRQLERLIRSACLHASRQGRDYLTAQDWS